MIQLWAFEKIQVQKLIFVTQILVTYIEWYEVRVYVRFQSSYGVPRNGSNMNEYLGFLPYL